MAAKRILKCFAALKGLKLTYARQRNPSDRNRLIAYADADHAGDRDAVQRGRRRLALEQWCSGMARGHTAGY